MTRQHAAFDMERGIDAFSPGPTFTDDRTETIDLDQVINTAVDESGSFDVRSIEMHEFSKLFEAIPTPLFLVDKTGSIVFMNESCSKISDDHRGLQGKAFADLFVTKTVRSVVHATMAEVFHTRRVKRVKAVMAINSRAIWARMHLRPLRMGLTRYLLILVEDLTSERARLLLTRKHQQSLQNEVEQRKKAEAAIRQSEANYRILCDNAPVGITCIDKQGKILFANPEASKIMALDAKDLEKTTLSSFIHEDDRHLLDAEEHDKTTNSSHADGFTCRIVAQGPTMKWVEIKSTDTDWNGVPATMHFMQDVTNKRKLEEEFVKIQKLESVGLLAGGIAHDFNNILTAILGNITLCKTTFKAVEEASMRLSDAERACMRAHGLTHQLLTFSKGGAPLKKPSALDTVIDESCRFALRGSNVGCDISFADGLWPAEVDAAQISQVMHNLAINAEQAMPDGGTVRINAENVQIARRNGVPLGPGNYVKITVEDDGDGISADVLPQIFDPYFTTKDGGTGLGLATAHSIVNNHGGAITVDSTVGQGSRFSVYLPATDAQPQPAIPAENALAPGKGKVLIMDDEEDIRELLSAALTQLGYQVKTATDGKEALALYAKERRSSNPFDSVVLDLTVPGGMGGKETAIKLRALDRKLRLIVSSGYSNDPVMVNYQEYGIDAVVPKPFTLAEITRALHNGNGQSSDGPISVS